MSDDSERSHRTFDDHDARARTALPGTPDPEMQRRAYNDLVAPSLKYVAKLRKIDREKALPSIVEVLKLLESHEAKLASELNACKRKLLKATIKFAGRARKKARRMAAVGEESEEDDDDDDEEDAEEEQQQQGEEEEEEEEEDEQEEEEEEQPEEEDAYDDDDEEQGEGEGTGEIDETNDDEEDDEDTVELARANALIDAGGLHSSQERSRRALREKLAAAVRAHAVVLRVREDLAPLVKKFTQRETLYEVVFVGKKLSRTQEDYGRLLARPTNKLSEPMEERHSLFARIASCLWGEGVGNWQLPFTAVLATSACDAVKEVFRTMRISASKLLEMRELCQSNMDSIRTAAFPIGGGLTLPKALMLENFVLRNVVDSCPGIVKPFRRTDGEYAKFRQGDALGAVEGGVYQPPTTLQEASVRAMRSAQASKKSGRRDLQFNPKGSGTAAQKRNLKERLANEAMQVMRPIANLQPGHSAFVCLLSIARRCDRPDHSLSPLWRSASWNGEQHDARLPTSAVNCE